MIAEHSEALEADLIRVGLRLRWLGSELLTWRDLLVFVKTAGKDSALAMAWDVSNMWGMTEQLLAAAVDTLRVLAWQNTEDAQAGRSWTAPDPIPRPGVTPRAEVNVIGGDEVLPIDEMRARLGMG